ncbi:MULTISPECIES: TetR/AcrR family transcriptional regulator [Paenarthrobacter]|uniref:TetR/AcrR family transcriptional regulator n=1 Tax=Paenarthrobacter TaxID=1742992 RepID=UPI0014080AB4|nr:MULTISPECIES: TetR/AcrR family transcriptional regulator [Paenarthrobacter]MCX8454874.1 TetR/AcrR family transcriptional regulator [Paenarthrobacter ureafaciens]MCY0973059.1 TetR/AcrR family transcriptional regulator [Paenarthrobacter ureafaciens]QOT17282.1 TetR/AcrR family transcriptional regulator [Paenarthrobacter sp. YJN-5]QQQ60634.1 TetR/AcrR family transcriptional regulator [Paenarthrobacter ureafaciens]UOD82984.1 TetR/AcrR family transcriptional regulator [Paenarthrobacter ureafacien
MSDTSYEVARKAFRTRLEEWNWAGQKAGRQNILEAFLKLAIAHGFNSVSMRTIANAVNVKPPSLYSHFPEGRDEIVAESLRWHFHRFGVALLEAVDPAKTADEFWDAMVRLHFTRQVRLPESNLWDLLVATDRMANILPTELRAQVDDWLSLHEEMYVAAARDMGCEDAGEHVRVVMTLLEGATRWTPADCGGAELEKMADRAVTLSRAILAVKFPD